MKDRKASNPDKFRAEFLKLLYDNGVKYLRKVFNYIYDTGKIAQDWLHLDFIAIPENAGAKRWSEYRAISLKSTVNVFRFFTKLS